MIIKCPCVKIHGFTMIHYMWKSPKISLMRLQYYITKVNNKETVHGLGERNMNSYEQELHFATSLHLQQGMGNY